MGNHHHLAMAIHKVLAWVDTPRFSASRSDRSLPCLDTLKSQIYIFLFGKLQPASITN